MAYSYTPQKGSLTGKSVKIINRDIVGIAGELTADGYTLFNMRGKAQEDSKDTFSWNANPMNELFGIKEDNLEEITETEYLSDEYIWWASEAHREEDIRYFKEFMKNFK
jgi:hypothetical protein